MPSRCTADSGELELSPEEAEAVRLAMSPAGGGERADVASQRVS